ncbi:sensor histidine kinase [Streptomyces thermocarboxydus]
MRTLDTGRQLAVYRVVQESLTNVLRHAGPAPRARVDVERAADAVTVTVTDTGAAPAAPKPGGHGLPGMRERVEAYGGTFEARATGTGWRVRARLPLDDAHGLGTRPATARGTEEPTTDSRGTEERRVRTP